MVGGQPFAGLSRPVLIGLKSGLWLGHSGTSEAQSEVLITLDQVFIEDISVFSPLSFSLTWTGFLVPAT